VRIENGCKEQTPVKVPEAARDDNWLDQSTLACRTCRTWVEKDRLRGIGRCRQNAPVVGQGWPVTYFSDWCGQHKLDHRKL